MSDASIIHVLLHVVAAAEIFARFEDDKIVVSDVNVLYALRFFQFMC